MAGGIKPDALGKIWNYGFTTTSPETMEKWTDDAMFDSTLSPKPKDTFQGFVFFQFSETYSLDC